MLIPIVAHLFNNGFTLSMMYFYRTGEVPINIEETENVPWEIALLSLVIVIGLMLTFKKKYALTKPNEISQLEQNNE